MKTGEYREVVVRFGRPKNDLITVDVVSADNKVLLISKCTNSFEIITHLAALVAASVRKACITFVEQAQMAEYDEPTEAANENKEIVE